MCRRHAFLLCEGNQCTFIGLPGLIKAVEAMWPKALRIRCWFHQMQNLMQKVPPQAWPECKALVSDLRAAPTVAAAERWRQAIVAESHLDFPEACRCLLEDGKASLSHLQVPPRHQQ